MFNKITVNDIAQETREFNEATEQSILAVPGLIAMHPSERREKEAQGTAPFSKPELITSAQDRLIDGPAGKIHLRIFAVENPQGVYLDIHGGGWCVGAADQQDAYLDKLAKSTKNTVISFDCRLAPEHPTRLRLMIVKRSQSGL